jgi:hypothetical protein
MFFLSRIPKILFSKNLRGLDTIACRQNLERLGLIRKILQNKDLALAQKSAAHPGCADDRA